MDILFSRDHIWIKKDGNTAFLGISEYAQDKLGPVMFLNLPDEEDEIECGKKFGDIESIKTVSDLISPLSGKIIKVNEKLVDEPDRINEEPYEAWFMKVEISGVSDGIINKKAYEEYCKTL